MENDENFEEMMDEFLKNASQEEIQELMDYIDKKEQEAKRAGHAPGGIPGLGKKQSRNPLEQMAQETAKNVQEQVGYTTDKVKALSRDIVRNMILQYDPYMPEEKISALVDMMISKEVEQKNLPPDVLISMIHQFVSYSTGEMSAKEKREMPEGWTERYWDNFPVDVQKMISAYLKGSIPKSAFWQTTVKMIIGEE